MTWVERAFPALLRGFFHQCLVAQRGASAHTIASYRDTFTLFLGYAAERTGRTFSALTLEDLDARMVLDFFDHLETERGNSARTRNLRLTAIRSFMRYASLREPTLLPVAQRLLAIPVKRFDRPVFDYLSREEISAIMDAPDRSTSRGQRDAVLLAVLYNTGARVSEMIRLHVADVLLDRASSLLVHGKGRKERVVPLWMSTATQLRAWLPRIDSSPDAPVVPNRAGQPLSRSGVEHQLRVACRKASQRHPALRTRRISPHTLRHTTAMPLLQSGVDITVIALWLGHEDTATTRQAGYRTARERRHGCGHHRHARRGPFLGRLARAAAQMQVGVAMLGRGRAGRRVGQVAQCRGRAGDSAPTPPRSSTVRP